MRNIVIFGLLAVMLQAGCSKDATIKPKDYPFVITRDADVTEDGATFYADIIDPGKFEIIKFWNEFFSAITSQNEELFFRNIKKTLPNLADLEATLTKEF